MSFSELFWVDYEQFSIKNNRSLIWDTRVVAHELLPKYHTKFEMQTDVWKYFLVKMRAVAISKSCRSSWVWKKRTWEFHFNYVTINLLPMTPRALLQNYSEMLIPFISLTFQALQFFILVQFLYSGLIFCSGLIFIFWLNF